MNDAELQPQDKFDELIGAVAAVEGDVAGASDKAQLLDLANELALLKGDFQKWESYKASADAYIKAFTDEEVWHCQIRFWVAVCCVFVILFLGVFFGCRHL